MHYHRIFNSEGITVTITANYEEKNSLSAIVSVKALLLEFLEHFLMQ